MFLLAAVMLLILAGRVFPQGSSSEARVRRKGEHQVPLSGPSMTTGVVQPLCDWDTGDKGRRATHTWDSPPSLYGMARLVRNGHKIGKGGHHKNKCQFSLPAPSPGG